MDFMEFINQLDSESDVVNLLNGTVELEDISDGARVKKWVMKDGSRYLYKRSKINSFGEYTYEHLSEFLAMRLGKMMRVPVVDIVLGGCDILSKVVTDGTLQSFLEFSDEFSHSFHLSNLTTFNISTLLNKENNPYWQEVIEMLLFDALIGNSDRHPGNFLHDGSKFYPLFDNGSSLCAYERDCNVEHILRDANRFNAICVTKSKPVLRDEQKITHKELVEILRRQHPREFCNFQDKISKINLSTLWQGITVPEVRKKLVTKFLETRMLWFR